jgi:hypothetical protein
LIITYWSIEHGGQEYILNYQNDQKHGTQYRWWPMSHGGHQSYIENYQFGQKHGVQRYWYIAQNGGFRYSIENYQNDRMI